MPKSILATMRDQHIKNVHKGEMITPSALKGCVRKLVLERSEDFWDEPIKLYYAVRGSLIHGFLEGHGLPSVHVEQRLYKTVSIGGKNIVVSGQIDDYDESEERITDFKTVSDKGTYFLFDTGAKPEHTLQTNIYAWLCDGGHLGSIDGPVVNWKVSEIVIAYLFMNRVVMTGSVHSEIVTSYKSPNYGKKYKLETGRAVIGHSPRGVPIWEISIKVPPVPLLSEEKIMGHLYLGANDVSNGFAAKREGRLPPGVLYDKEEAWQCGYCAVRGQCHAHEQQVNTEKFNTFIQVKK